MRHFVPAKFNSTTNIAKFLLPFPIIFFNDFFFNFLIKRVQSIKKLKVT